jgi:hypothetical protein
MSLAPAAVVTQPPLIPPTISLLTSVAVIDETDERWVNGFAYAPESPYMASPIFDLCDHSYEKNVTAASPPITGQPYGIVANDTCSTFSYKWRDYAARATRLLMANESWVIARELWTNTLGLNTCFTNAPSIVDATPGSGAVSLTLALAYIEQAYADYAPGVRPYIHMRPYAITAIAGRTGAGEYIRKEGNRRYTTMDSLIVADTGYPGTGPAGQAVGADSEWIFATSPVVVRHSPISVIPNNLSEATLRRENQVTFYAERAAHASFDYNNVVVALNIKRLT